MLLAVLQHVAEHIASLRRRRDDLVVIAIGEHLPLPAPELVERARERAQQRVHGTRDALSIIGFDQEVQMLCAASGYVELTPSDLFCRARWSVCCT